MNCDDRLHLFVTHSVTPPSHLGVLAQAVNVGLAAVLWVVEKLESVARCVRRRPGACRTRPPTPSGTAASGCQRPVTLGVLHSVHRCKNLVRVCVCVCTRTYVYLVTGNVGETIR